MGMRANRLIARRESADLVHWTPDLTVLDTDDADADSHLLLDEVALRAGKSAASARERAAAWKVLTEGETTGKTDILVRGRARQWYGITVFPYAGFYLGLAWLYDLPTGEIWPELVRSADGIQWLREPVRTAFIPRVPGATIFTMASPPVTVGDEIRVYYSVNNRNHHGVPNPDVEKGIRFATLKRDRWVGYAAGKNPGELLTQVIQNPGKLALNAAAEPGGWLRVEVTDSDGCPLAGFTQAESKPITGDGLNIVPRWRSGKTIAHLRVKDIRLRIHARRASIFALNF